MMAQPVVYIDAQFIATPEMGAIADEVATLWDMSDSMKPSPRTHFAFYDAYEKYMKEIKPIRAKIHELSRKWAELAFDANPAWNLRWGKKGPENYILMV
jgi:hypothetical protein